MIALDHTSRSDPGARTPVFRRRAPAWMAALLSCVAWPLAASAQTPDFDSAVRDLARLGPAHDVDEGGHVGLVQAIRDARNDTRVVILASHPDDQYVLPGAFLRFDDGYRVAVVLFTRGEGGQNITGPETGRELGELRTLETELCARRLGLEIHHLNRLDAGYCRTAEEALDLWGKERTIVDLARLLRRLRPDVVLTTHHHAETHGHDLALLEIMPEAVARAADPSQDLGAEPIPLPRVFRGSPDDDDGWFAMPTDGVDPDRGESIREIAWRALTESHRSQAPFQPSHEFFEDANRFVGVAIGDVPAPRTLYEGLPGLFDTAYAASGDRELLRELRSGFDEVLPTLSQNRKRLVTLAFALRERLDELEIDAGSDAAERVAARHEALSRVVREALGIHARVDVPSGSAAVPGETLRFTVELNTSGLLPLRDIVLSAPPGAGTLRITRDWDLSRPPPWFLEVELDVPPDGLARDPFEDLWARETFELPLHCDLRFRVELPSRSLSPPITSRLELPVLVRPPVSVRIHPHTLVVPDAADGVVFNVRVRRNTAGRLRGALRIDAPPGLVVEPAPIVDVDMVTEPEQGFRFSLRMPEGMREGAESLRVRIGRATDRVAVRRVPLEISRDLSVGLIEGVDDAARSVLRQFGVNLVELTSSELPTRSLDDLDSILIDIRALRHHEAARAEFHRLLDFAARGGRLVVLYHKDTEINVESTGIRFHPDDLPIHVGKGRVTREDAPVRVLLPEHPLVTTPNRIAPQDWDGWIQERGLYFPDEWADGYDALLELSDPREPPERGALLYARTGAGEYVYCSLALFRQLEQMHPGACRLLANLVTPSRP